ncbi:MAG: cardiolipin synthase [Planctomycetota bacterium]
MDEFSLYSLLSVGLLLFIQIGFGIRVLMRRQPLANTHAWLLVVLFLPLAGIFLYALIGENRLGRRRLKRFVDTTTSLEPFHNRLWAHREQRWDESERRFKHLAILGNNLCNSPALVGNELRLHADAVGTLDSMITDIDAATSHVHLLTYIFQESGHPIDVAEALIRAAHRGVECRVAVDGAGSRSFLKGSLCRKLRSSGVDVLELLPVNPLRLLVARIDLRNHRKMLVVDGTIAYTGSQNVTDDTFNVSRKSRVGPWIDATVRIQGPSARALGLVFIGDWNADSPRPIRDLDRYLPVIQPPAIDASSSTSAVQVLPSGPGSTPGAIQTAVLTTLYSAHEELIMTSPYFVPDQSVVAGLAAAAQRGVDTTVILPKHNNKRLVAAASRASFEDLLDAGVKILEFRPGLLHAKTITVDRDIALIGSANLDQRSFWINFEITVAVYDTDFASHLRMLQRDYANQSDQISITSWRRRTSVQRACDNAAQLFAPLL